MRFRTILVICLALGSGVLAVLGVRQLRSEVTDTGAIDTKPVVVSTVSIPRGSTLELNELKVVQWPTKMVPEGAVGEPEKVAGRKVAVPLVKGEPLLAEKLAVGEGGAGLAAMIPAGLRGFTIQTQHQSAGVGGFLLPGDRVDVLLTTTSNSRDDLTGGAATTTLLQNIPVIAVDELLEAPESDKVTAKDVKSVTVLVTPNQAAKLSLASNRGILHLSLRNPDDGLSSDAHPATLADLRFHQEPPLSERTAAMARQLAGFVSKAMLARPTASADVQDEPPTPRSTQIQTLRGVNRGFVRIDVK